jgi:hypothetical protein
MTTNTSTMPTLITMPKPKMFHLDAYPDDRRTLAKEVLNVVHALGVRLNGMQPTDTAYVPLLATQQVLLANAMTWINTGVRFHFEKRRDISSETDNFDVISAMIKHYVGIWDRVDRITRNPDALAKFISLVHAITRGDPIAVINAGSSLRSLL